ncbi:MAG: ExbD/TolR family protein [Phycisphaerales bacterium]
MRPVHHAPHGRINVTPLIDVILCLIIFFLLVGKLAHDRAAQVDLPASAGGTGNPGAPGLVVSIVAAPDSSPKVLADGVELSTDALNTLLRSRAPDSEVTIRADKSLAYEHVGPVIAACREAGLRGVRLAIRPAGGN